MPGMMPPPDGPQPSPQGPPQPQQGGMAPPAPQADVSGPGEEASPEEQEAYNVLVGAAMKIMYDQKKGLPTVLKRLRATDDPVQDLANASVVVFDRAAQEVKKRGATLNPDVLMHAGKEVLEQMVDVAEKAGVHDFSEDEIEGAWYQALDLYREIGLKRGDLDKNALTQDWNKIVQADKAGSLNQLLPGLPTQGEPENGPTTP